MACKLHRQFVHASSEKLLNLLKSAGKPWSHDKELHDEIQKVSKNCNIGKLYKKPSPGPIVGMPMAWRLQECVTMDLKFYKGKILPHLIDHATRLSMSTVIPSKNPDVILQAILKNWISVYGAAEFLSDNGDEFANESFLELCESLNIRVKTTGAEAPWSNGLVERHNLVIAERLDKVMEENQCSLQVTLAWCIDAKNSLQNVHGFSPFQLALGQNPKLSSVLSDKPPAFTSTSSSKILLDNLNALHKAREAFIMSESSERIRRALRHNVRTYSDNVFVTGDSVYDKRANDGKWKGPGKVQGQDGQQVLVKHRSTYVRCHPCRLSLFC